MKTLLPLQLLFAPDRNDPDPLVIYHGHNCPDGFASALAAWLFYEGKAEFQGLDHGNVRSVADLPALQGRAVYILDFSFSAEILRGIEERAAKLSANAQAFFGSPTSLEGLLPADSYQLIINDPASVLIAQMLKNLDEKVIPAFQAFSSYPGKLTAYQVLILASIVEKEASTPADRSGVAGVFYNRLAKGIKLESDVTVIYITGRTEPTATDLNSNSPYNTRKFAGLPPTPISVPSLAAIESTLKPTASSYIFFIGGKDGKTYYANTYAEHLINIDKYM